MIYIAVKRILVKKWNYYFDLKTLVLNRTIIAYDGVRNLYLSAPQIKSIDDTIAEILKNRTSVGRYGDGEFKLMNNQNISFQVFNSLLSQRLKEILLNEDPNFLVCLPDVFKDLSHYEDEPRNYWKLHMAKFRVKWYKFLNHEKVYYNSFISRCYYSYRDKSRCSEWFTQLKKIWDGREIVLVEGRKSRLGIGNDLFVNAKSIQRILVPEEDAFLEYDRILTETKKMDKCKLLLLAVGPTATVLANDLYKEGYQAIDIGHLDIEYEWFLRKAKTKTKIENKYVNEAGAGEGIGESQDINYLNEIIIKI
ncbi:SP_1767 family glycosyltransferase [Paenibacillus sp. GP183]|uniref:SP_1767 family glycosyltransferase n=1 Tax=Paenibacillus sp. GP183 TaxID=1882751 RepID=UPI000897976F|nr:SP_1767 family glycosyltransferase [Paenibacillus sp. GP183]SEC07367.1 glycosyltransferase, SP_1767 family [Paenibacillus sp. GP183]